MTKRLKKKGFTLVEMMVAMLAGVVLALTAGSMLVFGYTAWIDHTNSIKMQNDASLSMRVIGREIRESSVGDISYTANGLAFSTNAVRTNATSIVVLGNQLIFQPSGFILSEDWVNSFNAQTNGLGVDVTLYLRGGRRMNETIVNATFFPRN